MSLLNAFPISIRMPLDVGATLTSLSALFGLFTNIVGFVGACLSAIYLSVRLYDYLKSRKK